ncbi:ligase [Nocardiopsis sp. N85]|uniref:O-antigen ligase family protein n=1 Tax=Nocardiopsis sp. N85 TaxID=3029400 RepID=UPI00237F1D42|nr:ligase [Nocardiopsis sp. N85]MDE3720558.1 ligase [Nocardiopsis sp. N85]
MSPVAEGPTSTGRPLVWLLAGYPLWWALGLGQFAYWVFAVPMAVELMRRHRTVGLRVPPAFWLWALFLLWSLLGLAMVPLEMAGTVPGSGGYGGALLRITNYLVLTVLLLYVGNLTERELPTRAVVSALTVLGLVTIAGGYLGMFAPRFEFTAPLEYLLPGGLAADPFMQTLIHPASAQVMDIFGYDSARPKAPWEYTNVWGYMISLLLVWSAVALLTPGRFPLLARWGVAAAMALSVVPIVHSLNRALWAGLALSLLYAGYVAVRRGRVVPVALCSLVIVLALAVLAVSPLADVVRARADNPHSDDGRAATNAASVTAADLSPVLGWGTTREALGSSDSIAIGPSPDCPGCGQHVIGNAGQLWMTLIASGWVGTALFLGFFAATAWRYRSAVTIAGRGALLTVLLLFWYMFFYVALMSPLAVTMVAVALLWRDEEPLLRRRTARTGGGSR